MMAEQITSGLTPEEFELAIETVKQTRLEWIITEIDGALWFSDGSVMLRLPFGWSPAAHLTFGEAQRRWEDGLKNNLKMASAIDGWKRATVGDLVGAFGYRYCRALLVGDSKILLNERYVRLFPEASEFWSHPTDRDHSVVVRSNGQVAGMVMPLRTSGFNAVDESMLRLIPFLETAKLYHLCREEDC